MSAQSNNSKYEKATLGAGCFWCVEAVFQRLDGVVEVESGYSGGHVENPTYEQVCTKKTGHVEVARVTFDPAIISFEEILEVFWKIHDPTTKDRQGNDIGPQYRSAIFYHDEKQKGTAENSKTKLDKSKYYPNPAVTEISPLKNYFKAENYHQNYFNRVGNENPYCSFVVAPKVEKFKKEFSNKLKKD